MVWSAPGPSAPPGDSSYSSLFVAGLTLTPLHEIFITNIVGVWHTEGRSGGRILRNSRALVLQ